MFPVGCANHLDFIQTMVMMTLSPIGLVAVLFLSMWIEYELKKYQAYQQKVVMDKDLLFRVLKDKYLNYVFYITYLVLPSVTTTLFQIFLCTNIDPNHEGSLDTDDTYSDSNLYLTADMSISCNSSYSMKDWCMQW